jgi:hypothetical protein
MSNPESDREFTLLFSQPEKAREAAPSTLKARLYSALIRQQQTTGPLASLDVTVGSGHEICVFEKMVQIAPIGENAKSRFICGVCHARVLGETLENPPIFWPHCPYVNFKKS